MMEFWSWNLVVTRQHTHVISVHCLVLPIVIRVWLIVMALEQRFLDTVDDLSFVVNCLWCGKWHYGKGFDIFMQKNVEIHE